MLKSEPKAARTDPRRIKWPEKVDKATKLVAHAQSMQHTEPERSDQFSRSSQRRKNIVLYSLNSGNRPAKWVRLASVPGTRTADGRGKES